MLCLCLLFIVSCLSHAVKIAPECVAAMAACQRYKLKIVDTDRNGVIDIRDMGPQIVQFGLFWIDTDHNNQLSHQEVVDLYTRAVPWYDRFGIWAAVLLHITKYPIERVFTDCDANGDGIITFDDYKTLRYQSCMETCDKAEDVMSFLGIKFGAIPS